MLQSLRQKNLMLSFSNIWKQLQGKKKVRYLPGKAFMKHQAMSHYPLSNEAFLWQHNSLRCNLCPVIPRETSLCPINQEQKRTATHYSAHVLSISLIIKHRSSPGFSWSFKARRQSWLSWHSARHKSKGTSCNSSEPNGGNLKVKTERSSKYSNMTDNNRNANVLSFSIRLKRSSPHQDFHQIPWVKAWLTGQETRNPLVSKALKLSDENFVITLSIA